MIEEVIQGNENIDEIFDDVKRAISGEEENIDNRPQVKLPSVGGFDSPPND